MKKLLCLVLTLCLIASLTVPALAADDTADDRLAAVTGKVKETLDLNTDAFDTFYGNFYEDALMPVWNLNWSGSSGNLTIQADENGTIMSYYFYDKSNSDSYYARSFSPSFPKGDEPSARAAAETFLGRVLDSETESVKLEPSDNQYLGSTQFNYSGKILLSGLTSPFSYYITVRAADNTIIQFSRDSKYTKFLGDTPSAEPSASSGNAGVLLKTTLGLRLEYVLTEDGKTAVLRYLPESGDQYYVDAQTGKLVNLTELYQDVSDRGEYGLGGATAASDDKATAAAPLTEAEQEGIAKLDGVLSKETLDTKLRQISQLGLSRYTLSSASYSVDQSTGDVSCRLQYVRQTDDGLWRRYLSTDAKTGALQSVYSSIPWSEDKDAGQTVSAEAAQTKAEQFLATYYGTDYAALALYGNDEPVSIYSDYTTAHSFRFVQKENGYFYTGNYYNVSIDASDGSISSFNFHFDRDITFDSADGIISMDAALDAYYGIYQVQLGYLAVPEKLDPNTPEYQPLIAKGYSYLYSLALAYTLEQNDAGYLSGIDAKTGEPILTDYSTQKTTVTYDDLSGHWVQARAQKLAQYHVGWLGGSFLPDKQLTQFDLVCLLVSTNGYLYDPSNTDKETMDKVYDVAYSMNLLDPAERSDSQPVTRGELVKLVLNAGGYQEVANLSGIFRCSFGDESSIPAAYYGYAALAQGLGIISGDGAGNFAASRISTRAEAAAILYNLMSK